MLNLPVCRLRGTDCRLIAMQDTAQHRVILVSYARPSIGSLNLTGEMPELTDVQRICTHHRAHHIVAEFFPCEPFVLTENVIQH